VSRRRTEAAGTVAPVSSVGLTPRAEMVPMTFYSNFCSRILIVIHLFIVYINGQGYVPGISTGVSIVFL
jgi:hypothetical protein